MDPGLEAQMCMHRVPQERRCRPPGSWTPLREVRYGDGRSVGPRSAVSNLNPPCWPGASGPKLGSEGEALASRGTSTATAAKMSGPGAGGARLSRGWLATSIYGKLEGAHPVDARPGRVQPSPLPSLSRPPAPAFRPSGCAPGRGIGFPPPHGAASYLWERDYGFLMLNFHAEVFSMDFGKCFVPNNTWREKEDVRSAHTGCDPGGGRERSVPGPPPPPCPPPKAQASASPSPNAVTDSGHASLFLGPAAARPPPAGRVCTAPGPRGGCGAWREVVTALCALSHVGLCLVRRPQATLSQLRERMASCPTAAPGRGQPRGPGWDPHPALCPMVLWTRLHSCLREQESKGPVHVCLWVTEGPTWKIWSQACRMGHFDLGISKHRGHERSPH